MNTSGGDEKKKIEKNVGERAGVSTNQTTENRRKKKQETAEEPGDRVAPAPRGHGREPTKRKAGHGLQIRRAHCAGMDPTTLARQSARDCVANLKIEPLRAEGTVVRQANEP